MNGDLSNLSNLLREFVGDAHMRGRLHGDITKSVANAHAIASSLSDEKRERLRRSLYLWGAAQPVSDGLVAELLFQLKDREANNKGRRS